MSSQIRLHSQVEQPIERTQLGDMRALNISSFDSASEAAGALGWQICFARLNGISQFVRLYWEQIVDLVTASIFIGGAGLKYRSYKKRQDGIDEFIESVRLSSLNQLDCSYAHKRSFGAVMMGLGRR